ncbi:hypothetical protein M1E08_12190 [Erwinia sp. PK3-005]|uniref:C-type lysozyme inhibitor domain-containing protein n=1 Tax=Mixta hanseatica TaxID=2872648 RepID=A0ABY4RC97_9GAMM|nr:hypothetical protein [Mixta hanseatica]UQY45810.1 hypothetical protein K6958_09285 [Mixta hanseatica]
MKKLWLAAGLLTLVTSSAWSETEFQITCPGRAVMTISRAQYGLTTLMWPQRHFQVASGQTRHTMENGARIAITRFRNGDRLIINQSNGEVWFAYHNTSKLLPCSRSAKREVEAITLERFDDRNHINS